MNDVIFNKNFCFNFHTFRKQRYTDNRGGSPYHYIAYMLKGHSKIVSKERTIEVGPGDLFYIPKGLPYQSYWDSKDDIQFLSFGFHFFPEAKSKQFILQKIICSDTLKEKVKEIPINANIDSSVIGVFYSVLSTVAEHLDGDSEMAGNKIIELAKQYIYDNISCSVSDIARHCHLSKSALYNIFKKECNLTPNALIQKVRCKKAEILLTTTNKSVQEISDILEFSSTSYFRKIFKYYTGKSPREHRNNAVSI